MKKFLVFAGETYYPSGGWEDYCGEFDNLSDAIAHAESLGPSSDYPYRWAHVADVSHGKIVFEVDMHRSGLEDSLDGDVHRPVKALPEG